METKLGEPGNVTIGNLGSWAAILLTAIIAIGGVVAWGLNGRLESQAATLDRHEMRLGIQERAASDLKATLERLDERTKAISQTTDRTWELMKQLAPHGDSGGQRR